MELRPFTFDRWLAKVGSKNPKAKEAVVTQNAAITAKGLLSSENIEVPELCPSPNKYKLVIR